MRLGVKRLPRGKKMLVDYRACMQREFLNRSGGFKQQIPSEIGNTKAARETSNVSNHKAFINKSTCW